MSKPICYFTWDLTHGLREYASEQAWRIAWLQIEGDPGARYWIEGGAE